MHRFRLLPIIGALGFIITIASMNLIPALVNAVSSHEKDNASQKDQEQEDRQEDETENDQKHKKSTDHPEEAGWMQVSRAYAAQSAQPESNVAQQKCEERQPEIRKKITAIAISADSYEKKLTAIYAEVSQLRKTEKIRSPEIDTLVMTANSVKESRVDPVLVQLMSFETTQKVVCAAGVENVIATLIQVQSTTDQLRDGLAEYRNSIKAVVFAVRDYSKEMTR